MSKISQRDVKSHPSYIKVVRTVGDDSSKSTWLKDEIDQKLYIGEVARAEGTFTCDFKHEDVSYQIMVSVELPCYPNEIGKAIERALHIAKKRVVSEVGLVNGRREVEFKAGR